MQESCRERVFAHLGVEVQKDTVTHPFAQNMTVLSHCCIAYELGHLVHHSVMRMQQPVTA